MGFIEDLKHLKWRALVFVCMLTFGSYYVYDFPGAIGTGPKHTISQRFATKGDKDYTQTMNQSLYSVYYWPNLVMAFLWGIIIDKYLGLSRTMLLCTSMIVVSSIVFYVGVLVVSYPVMLASRIMFGVFGEALTVGQGAYIARWFKDGKGLAFAFGMTIAVLRCAAALNYAVSPRVAAAHDVTISCLIGSCCCIVSFLCSVLLVKLDHYGTEKGIVEKESLGANTTMRLADIVKLPALIWAASFATMFLYASIFPFMGIAENFIERKYNKSATEAGNAVTIYEVVSAIGTPLIGAAIDRVGRFSYFVIVPGVLFAIVHLLFILTAIPATVMMVFVAVAYGFLAATVWSLVPFAVPPNVIGISFGLMTGLMDIGLAVFPIISGAILDSFTPPEPTLSPGTTPAPTQDGHHHYSTDLPTIEGYNVVLIVFIGTSVVSILLGIVTYVFDHKFAGGILSASPDGRKRIIAEREEHFRAVMDGGDDAAICDDGKDAFPVTELASPQYKESAGCEEDAAMLEESGNESADDDSSNQNDVEMSYKRMVN